MRISTLFLLSLFISISIQAQDGIKVKLNGTDAFHMHENSNGSYMFEVEENNTFFGQDAGSLNNLNGVDGRYGSFFGHNAGKSNSNGAFNTFIGSRSGEDNSSGDYLTFLGYNSGHSNISGHFNTAIGSYSSYSNTGGQFNTTVGSYSNYFNNGGQYNVCIGYEANYYNVAGEKNTILGYQAGRKNSAFDSDGNVFIGYQAGYHETGNNKLYIENSSATEPLIYAEFNNNELEINGDLTIDVPVGSVESRSEIKFAHEGTTHFTIDYDGSTDKFEVREGNSQLMIFSDANIGVKRTPITNDLEVNGTASKSSAGDWIANSDARLKKNMKPLNSSLILSKLLQLKGITYEWNDPRTNQDRPYGEQYGFTAQNIEKVFPELVSTDNEGYLQTSYGTYDAMYIEAIRALCDKIDVLEQRLNEIENGTNLED